MTKKYIRVDIHSESDLPKEDGMYYAAKSKDLKIVGIKPILYTTMASTKKRWLKDIAWYLIEESQPSDEEIQKYVTDRFSNSHLLPEIIAFRAIKYYLAGMPPVNDRKCVLDQPTLEENKAVRTAEEILHKYIHHLRFHGEEEAVLKAMEEYANQFK